MTYQPLARKYRPTRFAELVGQEAVARALASAITLSREPHAVLFTGVRGVGKTTVARLYAKALNCANRSPEAEPCNTCESCAAIAAGRHEDVLEIDGASNTGVDSIRELQETVGYVSQRSAFKVYIIDEVHMLSQAAFNALLKTLEEPPSHVVFVFATTELQKVPATILSRCQAFYLRKLPNAAVKARLAEIVGREGVQAEDRALAVIAREGHGSMRDALTLLDQAVILGNGAVTIASLGPIVSNLSSSPYLELLKAMVTRDTAKAMAQIAALDQAGAELGPVAEETANLARHGFIIQGLGADALDVGMLGLDDAEVSKLTEIVRASAPFDLNRIFRTLVKARGELDGSALDRYVFENYVYEWCLDPGLPDIESLMNGEPKRADVSSRVLAQATTNAPDVQTSATPATPAAPRTLPRASEILKAAAAPVAAQMATTPEPVAATPKGSMVLPETWRLLVDAWRISKPLSARKLEEAHALVYGPDRIVLGVSEASYASKGLLQKDEQSRIRDQFRELFGFTGLFMVQPLEAPVKDTAVEVPVLPETVLTERSREADDRRQKLKEDAVRAPFTQDLLSALGGTIEDVKIVDGKHP